MYITDENNAYAFNANVKFFPLQYSRRRGCLLLPDLLTRSSGGRERLSPRLVGDCFACMRSPLL